LLQNIFELNDVKTKTESLYLNNQCLKVVIFYINPSKIFFFNF